jgi:hypothetical protein
MKSTRKRIKNDLRQIFKKNVDFMCGFPRFFHTKVFFCPGAVFSKTQVEREKNGTRGQNEETLEVRDRSLAGG